MHRGREGTIHRRAATGVRLRPWPPPLPLPLDTRERAYFPPWNTRWPPSPSSPRTPVPPLGRTHRGKRAENARREKPRSNAPAAPRGARATGLPGRKESTMRGDTVGERLQSAHISPSRSQYPVVFPVLEPSKGSFVRAFSAPGAPGSCRGREFSPGSPRTPASGNPGTSIRRAEISPSRR